MGIETGDKLSDGWQHRGYEIGPKGNPARKSLQSRGFAFGTMIGIAPNPAIVAIISEVGYDFVTIDMEHSRFSWLHVADLCVVANALGITPIVRLQEGSQSAAGRALDLGARGLMFHDVESPQQMESIRRWTRDAKAIGRSTDVDSAREELLVIVQVESRQGLDNVAKILEVGGMDVVEIGRGDLTASLGHGRERKHPQVLSAIDQIVAECTSSGIGVGMVATEMTDAEVDDLVKRGIRWITFGTDRHILMRGLRDGIGILGHYADELSG